MPNKDSTFGKNPCLNFINNTMATSCRHWREHGVPKDGARNFSQARSYFKNAEFALSLSPFK